MIKYILVCIMYNQNAHCKIAYCLEGGTVEEGRVAGGRGGWRGGRGGRGGCFRLQSTGR